MSQLKPLHKEATVAHLLVNSSTEARHQVNMVSNREAMASNKAATHHNSKDMGNNKGAIHHSNKATAVLRKVIRHKEAEEVLHRVRAILSRVDMEVHRRRDTSRVGGSRRSMSLTAD